VYVPPELKVLHPRSRIAVVEVLGEHDLSTEDEARDLFLRLVSENELVVIDLSETEFVDSSFLAILMRSRTAAHEQGHSVLLQVKRESNVGRTLEMTGLLKLFNHVSTREEALHSNSPADALASSSGA
jgi:anti-anti-sigma factor